MAYNNLNRSGLRSTTSVNPRAIFEDLDEQIRTLDPEAVPLQTISEHMGKGPSPQNHKIEVMQYDSFDNYDIFNSVVMGLTADGESRYAKVTPAQKTRPITKAANMYYKSQDTFYIAKTGQTVEVVMTDSDSIPTGVGANGSTYSLQLKVASAGGATLVNATPFGQIVVRNTEPYPLLPFDSSDVVFLGRTIYEGQNIEATPTQRDFVYDCNFVEHMEAVIHMTDDQKDMVKMRTKIPDWTFQQKELLKEFKKSVEYKLVFGERNVDYTIPGLPKRYLRGLVHSITDNVAYYNPDSTDNFEKMFSMFLFQSAFKYNPNGKKKMALCGPTFLFNFSQHFWKYRQTSPTLDVKEKTVGIDIESYRLPGGFTIDLVRTDLFRQNTPMEHWCVVIDPPEMELRVRSGKDYNTKMYTLAHERIAKLMVEWQGSIAFHRTESFAFLKPFGS